MRPANSLEPAYFDRLYAEKLDPWDFATSGYEDAKYGETVGSLAGRRYGRGLEVGCSIGVLTHRLAGHCDRLIATDVARQAVRAAEARNRDRPNVEFRISAFPHETPEGTFDLIVLSEVLYYLSREDLALAATRTVERLDPGGDVVLVHWLGDTDYPLTGDEAAEAFIRQSAPPLTIVQQTRRERYRLDLLRRES